MSRLGCFDEVEDVSGRFAAAERILESGLGHVVGVVMVEPAVGLERETGSGAAVVAGSLRAHVNTELVEAARDGAVGRYVQRVVLGRRVSRLT